MRSREVLDDCRTALADFRASGARPYWRTRWTGLVALLRAAGHVLDKVDGAQSTQWRLAVDNAWDECKKTQPNPRILWEFIEAERNNVLKAYDVGACVNITVRPAPAILSFSPTIAPFQKSKPTTYETFLRTGFYNGQDAEAVCEEAIEFWNNYLNRVETEALKQP